MQHIAAGPDSVATIGYDELIAFRLIGSGAMADAVNFIVHRVARDETVWKISE